MPKGGIVAGHFVNLNMKLGQMLGTVKIKSLEYPAYINTISGVLKMKNTSFIAIISLIALCYCTDEYDKVDYVISPIDTLTYYNTDSVYISRIAQVEVWRNYILISDFDFHRIWAFDNNFDLVSYMGGKGYGPGEYPSHPVIINSENFIYILDTSQKKINQYNANFDLVSYYSLPEEIIYMPERSIKVKNKFVFFGAAPEPINNLSYYIHNNSLFTITDDFSNYKNIIPWDPIYRDKKNLTFISENFRVLLAKKENNQFYVLQGASHIIHLYNYEFEEELSFGEKPKYFKDPPSDLTPQDVQTSIETIADYASKTTSLMKMCYDPSIKYVYVNYTNFFKEYFYQRSWLLGKHYLQVYDENGDCLLDEEIPGLLKFVKEGKFYVLVDENPNFIKFISYKIVKKVK